jgi:hypothetical protein
MIMRYGTYVVGAAAGIAALVYIGRKVGQVAVIMQLLARLPDEHMHLLQATKDNTTAIARLTTQVSELAATVARLVGQ